MGPAWACCADIGERHAGALSGAMNMTGQFFAAVAMAFAGMLFQQELDDLVFITFACSYALAALCWLLIDGTKPLEHVALQAREADAVVASPFSRQQDG